MASFNKFISSFSNKNHIKGKQFEYFVKYFFETDNYWKSIVKKVWLFKDSPINWGEDTGTDLIFIDKDNRYWAIQAKLYNQDYSITKKDINTFLSDSNRQKIFKRILICTTNHFSRQGLKTIKSQEKKVQIIALQNLIDKGNIFPDSIKNLSKKNINENIQPKYYQKDAIHNVINKFKKNDKGQLIMACGTGKTFTYYWIHEKIKSKKTLILVPSLSLLSQTIREWYRLTKNDFESLCICSDKSTTKNIKKDEIILNPSELPYSVTSNILEIKNFFKKKEKYVIFATYQSSNLIQEAQKNTKHQFDLSIADESHKCVGKQDTNFSLILDDKKIKSKKKLFTTATPKIFPNTIKKQAISKSFELYDMNDKEVFGDEFYKYSFAEAIRDKQLSDYKLVLYGAENDKVKELIINRKFIKANKALKTDAMSFASQIGLIKTIKKQNLKKIITFHGNIPKTTNFVQMFPNVFEWTKLKEKISKHLFVDYVTGNMSSYKRKIKLDYLKNIDQNQIGILSNARCLSEGVDVPSLDGIAFFDTKKSEIDIVQSIGRAIRKPKDSNKKYGYIMVPIFLSESETLNQTIDKSKFKSVIKIINALRSHDEDLKIEIDNLKLGVGKKTIIGGSKKIEFNLPFEISKEFQDKINTFIVKNLKNDWMFYFNLLKDYEKEHKTTVMTQTQKYKGITLGRWANEQRYNFNNGKIYKYRIKLLESFPDWSWGLRLSMWDNKYNALVDYIKTHKKMPSRNTRYKGYELGFWISHQIGFYNKGNLSKERIQKLESLELWSWKYDFWNEMFNALLVHYKSTKTSYIERKRNEKNPDIKKLSEWIQRQRNLYKKSELDRKKINLLDKTFHDWVWNVLDEQWMRKYNLLLNYLKKNKTTKVKQKLIIDNVNIGSWASKQKERYKEGKISKKRKAILEKLPGWYWV